MIPFERILDEAAARAGGAEALQRKLPIPKTAEALRAVSDDRYLSLLSQRIFRAGLKHEMVDAKWPAFKEVFHGFDPERVRFMSEDALQALLADSRIIRHWSNIKAVRANAQALCEIAAETGSMGAYLAAWPRERIVDLWHELGKRFTQLGGLSGPYFLRMAGKDTFLLTDAVVRALVHWGAVPRETERQTRP